MLRPTSMLAALAVAAATKHYGIVFDAGSSGTRIHVYTWQTGGGGPKDAFDLLSDDLLKIKPGLSAYKDKPSEAGTPAWTPTLVNAPALKLSVESLRPQARPSRR
jgi:hypothetical protein